MHNDVKLNKAEVMFSFVSPDIALTVSMMVPGKVRIFWEAVWICWEFWSQSPLLTALHREENRHLQMQIGHLNLLRPILVKVQLDAAL